MNETPLPDQTSELDSLPSSQRDWRTVAFWSSVSALGGTITWYTARYWSRLLRQPALRSPELSAAFEAHRALEAKAHAIASDNLRAGIESRHLPDGRQMQVLCAGLRNFREPWARDLGFASFGLMELEELQATKESLQVFLLNQLPSGQFPVKVHSTNVIDRYLHSLFSREQPTRNPIRPKYITAHNTISLDGNSLLIIAVLNYSIRSGDMSFTLEHWSHLKRAIRWLEQHALEEDGLLHQSSFADWADSIARQGKVLYPNVLYWKALHDLASMAEHHGKTRDARLFAAKADYLKHSINDHFWRADLGYFVTSRFFDNLSSCGNLLAVAWELATAAQANAILDAMEHFDMASPVPTQVVHRAYPKRFIALENRLAGIPHYHTSAAWIWLGAWHIIALARVGRLARAEEYLYRIASVIVRDGAVHEVYGTDGNYLSTRFYTSEAPLTWSAGMFVHAYHVYERRLKTALDTSIPAEGSN